MHNEELNPPFWRDRFSQYLASFPLSSGEWRAELKQDPMPAAIQSVLLLSLRASCREGQRNVWKSCFR